MKTLKVNLPGREYQIDIGQNILDIQLPKAVKRNSTAHVVVVTNTTLQELYPNFVFNLLADSGVKVSTCVLPDGEKYKNLDTLSMVFDFLMDVCANRKSLLIAFGGGVIGDMAGFAASTFVRGIPFIQVPTTLLSDVDSSVGGKTAVNHPSGKNTIGTFKQPEYVCIELSFLKTLPSRELKAGHMELLKHGLIQDADFFNYTQQHSLEPLDFDYLEEAIFRSCKIKAKIVEKDETEKGLRANLNFGHTLGHLIETHAGYGKYLHGEAVGAGMLFATFVSWRRNEITLNEWDLISSALTQYLMPLKLLKMDFDTFRNLILHDKKAQKQAVNFILLNKLGKSFIFPEMSVEILWEEFNLFVQEYPGIIRLE
ncbi:MAG: 3-dehydroquinate synthase [Proteobacteria bacterium]|nr:MAG: 3-dehydroquinate synthase [Pseudomonadota bacterium]|tara:strand:+ start:1161 stop:2267 length:1107 start_codon:yes stop_codon:yes gene_type:complete